MAKKVKPTYVEPSSYFPEEIRKQFKLGEYSDIAIKRRQGREAQKETEKASTKKVKKTTKKK